MAFDNGNGGWKIVAMLAVGGTIGGGSGMLTGAMAGDERVRQLIAQSPELAVVKTIQAEIRDDVAELSLRQRQTTEQVAEANRKMDRLLYIIEGNGGG